MSFRIFHFLIKRTYLCNTYTHFHIMQNLQDFFTTNHMEEVLQSLNTIPWVFDFKRNVITSNLAYIDTKYSHGQAIHQQSFEEFIKSILPEYREKMLEVYSRVKNGIVTRTSIQMQMRMGEKKQPVWVEMHIVVKEKDSNGITTKAVGCTAIIQSRKEMEHAMMEAKKKAEQANMIKTNFLASMTHEFRTPLNSILGFSTIMAHSNTIEERMQCLGAVQSSGSMLLQIVDDVIQLARLEANEVELHRHLIDINNLLENCVEEAKPMRKEGVQMVYHHTEAPIILHGDDEKIAMVTHQILDNACKYTEHGSIDVYCHKGSEHAVITIKDTGAGMPSETVHHIYDRFFKGNTFVPGTGLGMSVVKGMVDLWDGTIKVESEVGEGTSVTFTVPLHASFYQNRTLRSMQEQR